MPKYVIRESSRNVKLLKESLLSDLRAAGVPASDIDSHESDLYVRVTPKSTPIVKNSEYGKMAKTFKDNIDGVMWYDIPFQNDDFWAGKARGESARKSSKPRVNEAASVVDEDAANELVLYAENDSRIYSQFERDFIPNIVNKVRRGVWDSEKGVVLIGYLMDRAAQQYVKEMGSPGDRVQDVFNKATRLAAAREYLDGMQDIIDDAVESDRVGREASAKVKAEEKAAARAAAKNKAGEPLKEESGDPQIDSLFDTYNELFGELEQYISVLKSAGTHGRGGARDSGGSAVGTATVSDAEFYKLRSRVLDLQHIRRNNPDVESAFNEEGVPPSDLSNMLRTVDELRKGKALRSTKWKRRKD